MIINAAFSINTNTPDDAEKVANQYILKKKIQYDSDMNLHVNFILIKSLNDLIVQNHMKYEDIKSISDFVIDKLYEEKDLWLLTYFYFHIESDEIKKDIDIMVNMLKADIQAAIDEQPAT